MIGEKFKTLEIFKDGLDFSEATVVSVHHRDSEIKYRVKDNEGSVTDGCVEYISLNQVVEDINNGKSYDYLFIDIDDYISIDSLEVDYLNSLIVNMELKKKNAHLAEKLKEAKEDSVKEKEEESKFYSEIESIIGMSTGDKLRSSYFFPGIFSNFDRRDDILSKIRELVAFKEVVREECKPTEEESKFLGLF